MQINFNECSGERVCKYKLELAHSCKKKELETIQAARGEREAFERLCPPC